MIVCQSSQLQRETPGSAEPAFKLPPGDWFSANEAAALIGVSASFVEKEWDRGLLFGLSLCAGAGKRKRRRIHRAAVITYLIRSSDSVDDSLAAAFEACVPQLSHSQLFNLRAAVDRCLGAN